MPTRRKNISASASESIPETGSQVVKTTTETIRTEPIPEKEQISEPVPPPIQVYESELVLDDQDDEPAFALPDDSVFAQLYEPDNDFESLRGSVVVSRKPDMPGQQFRTPCRVTTNYPSMPVDIYTTKPAIHESVRETSGGGNYRFQLRAGTGFQNVVWEITLADLPSNLPPVQNPSAPPSPVQTAAVEVKPLDATKSKIEEAMERAMLKKLETLFDDKPAPQAAPVVQPFIIDNPYALVNQAAQSNNVELFSTAVQLLKDDDKKMSGWDFAASILDNPERVEGGIQIVGAIATTILSIIKPAADATETPPVRRAKKTAGTGSNVTDIRQRLQERQRQRELKNAANTDIQELSQPGDTAAA